MFPSTGQSGTPKRRKKTERALLIAALFFALAGQYYLSQLKDRLWDGVFLYAVAAFCLLQLISRRLPPRSPMLPSLWKRAWSSIQAEPWRAWVLFLSAFCLYTAIRLNGVDKNWQAILFWLLGIAGSIGMWIGLRQEPLAPREADGPSAQDQPEAEPPPAAEESQPVASVGRAATSAPAWARWEVAVLIGCTLAALLLRVLRLGTIPFIVSGDEASMGIEAVNALQGRLINPFATGWLSHPTMYFFLMSGPISLLGQTAWGLRLLSALAGSATIPALYILARRLFDRRVALAGMVLLTVAHLHIHFSRLGINNIYDPLFGLLAFFFLTRGLQEGHLHDFALSGVMLGFGQFFYFGGRLFPIMFFCYIVILILLQPDRRNRLWASGGALLGGFFATGAPLFRFFLLHPQDFMARMSSVGILQSGWLKAAQEATGKSVPALLWQQFRQSILAFNYTLDPTSWYAAKIPYLDFVSGLFFVLGLVLIARSWRKPGHLILNLWFWLALFFGGVLIENPPSSPRFVIFTPAVCLIAAVGLGYLLEQATVLAKVRRTWVLGGMAAILLLACVLNIGYYFFRYTPARIYGGLNTEVGTRVGEYLHKQKPGSFVYFFGPPRMWVHYATIPFLAPGMELADVETPLAAPPELGSSAQDMIFIFLPERVGELQWVMQAYPGGEREEVPGHTGNTLFVAYRYPGRGN